jgi:hypothetical protein
MVVFYDPPRCGLAVREKPSSRMYLSVTDRIATLEGGIGKFNGQFLDENKSRATGHQRHVGSGSGNSNCPADRNKTAKDQIPWASSGCDNSRLGRINRIVRLAKIKTARTTCQTRSMLVD